ncbi:MAG: DUF3604 domain-containing protein, partial [Gammaproteobacteria bacterium]|nr:DUF3604 domain-containing protein [Gammaproteobacteria bacterium]
VAASNERAIRNNQVKPVGNTVDGAQASYRNSIGAPNLSTVWEDPDFDPAIKSFYYVRVLEIPTPTWPVIDAAHFGDQLPDNVPPHQQERAYTSPIWYSP